LTPEEALAAIVTELSRAERLFPSWPIDPIHAAAIVAEESGELTQAALDYFYGRQLDEEHMKQEAVHTAAMALRFLLGSKYRTEKGRL
jgi:phosphoserine phosphatase